MIRRIRIVLIILIALAALVLVFEITRPYRPDNIIDSFVDDIIGRIPEYDEDEEDASPVYFELPAGTDFDGQYIGEYIVITEERRDYEHDGMILVIPSLGLRLPVRAGTSQWNLSRGPGLFESSGMPGQPEANVSIAGHRTRNQFYYLDRMNSGDRLQIIHDSQVYTYVFYDRDVVLPSDWSVIAEQGFDCVTLVTCTPIGVANMRMVVRFELESTEPLPDTEEATDDITPRD